jgi:hypothetical protein
MESDLELSMDYKDSNGGALPSILLLSILKRTFYVSGAGSASIFR